MPSFLTAVAVNARKCLFWCLNKPRKGLLSDESSKSGTQKGKELTKLAPDQIETNICNKCDECEKREENEAIKKNEKMEFDSNLVVLNNLAFFVLFIIIVGFNSIIWTSIVSA